MHCKQGNSTEQFGLTHESVYLAICSESLGNIRFRFTGHDYLISRLGGIYSKYS